MQLHIYPRHRREQVTVRGTAQKAAERRAGDALRIHPGAAHRTKPLWFSVGCAGAQHPLSGWNKDAAVGILSGKSGTAGSLFTEAGSVSCL